MWFSAACKHPANSAHAHGLMDVICCPGEVSIGQYEHAYGNLKAFQVCTSSPQKSTWKRGVSWKDVVLHDIFRLDSAACQWTWSCTKMAAATLFTPDEIIYLLRPMPCGTTGRTYSWVYITVYPPFKLLELNHTAPSLLTKKWLHEFSLIYDDKYFFST
jgi:hypothetical protein